MAKKSGNEGFQEVPIEEIEEAAKQLASVAEVFQRVSGRLSAEKLPPMRLPFASRQRSVKNLVWLSERLEGMLNTHRREVKEMAAGKAAKDADRKQVDS